ncbi:MAG TPA: pyruvate formate lyase family protein, partial [Draconibacterium sp.]|nr:pyruvate formate lyase family protein [Draconibacterium sp.]
MTERVLLLKNKISKERRFVSIDQAQIITRVFKNTEGEPRNIRRAKSFLASCNEISICIDPLELIVGNRTPESRAGVGFPEAGIQWLDEEIENLPIREQDKFFVREKDIQILREDILPYWKGQSLEDTIKSGTEGKEIKRLEKVLKINQKDHAQGHILPDVQTWLKLGPKGIFETFSHAKNKETDTDKKLFYKSVCISLEGAISFINRYGLLAAELSENAASEQLKAHFRKISGVCKNCANKPPETFHEALQSIWFLFVLLQLESNASSFSPGRMDRYLYPYYQKDIEKGILTKEEALELISCLWLKFNEIVYLRNAHSAKFFAGFPIGFNVAVGGVDENGNSAENELSYIMLEAQKILGLPQPNLSARIG